MPKIILLVLLLAACTPTIQAPSAAPATLTPTAFLPQATTPNAAPALPDTPAQATTPSAPAPTLPGQPELAPSPTPNLPLGPTPSAQAPLPAYALHAAYDYTRHTLSVSERITFPNPADQALEALLLVVEANRYPDSFALEALSVDDQALTDYTLEGNRLTLSLPHPLETGGTLTLALAYTLRLPEIPDSSDVTQTHPYGFTLRQANIVDWYPYLPPYQQAGGWLAPAPGSFGEHQVFPRAHYDVTLRVSNIGAPLVVAASAPAEQEGDTYHYQLVAARSFAISVSPMYQVLQGSVGDIVIYSYCFTYDTEAGQAALDHTAQALALYQELFGAYPHASLSVVQADFPDGMEFEGLYFISRSFYNSYNGTPAGYLTTIAVHETAHQWWYGLVGNNQAEAPWLDEALCTYTERLYYERYYPELLAWWWAYRVDFYEPSGAIGGAIYDYPTFRAYRDAVYLNGARFLEAVRQQMGDEAFFAALRAYAARFSGQIVAAPDFLNTLGAHTDEDLTPMITKFFEGQ